MKLQNHLHSSPYLELFFAKLGQSMDVIKYYWKETKKGIFKVVLITRHLYIYHYFLIQNNFSLTNIAQLYQPL